MHSRNDQFVTFLRWVHGVHGARVHQPMASAGQELSIKHAEWRHNLTAAPRAQQTGKHARARTAVVLLIVWHPRGLHGVLVLPHVAQVRDAFRLSENTTIALLSRRFESYIFKSESRLMQTPLNINEFHLLTDWFRNQNISWSLHWKSMKIPFFDVTNEGKATMGASLLQMG